MPPAGLNVERENVGTFESTRVQFQGQSAGRRHQRVDLGTYFVIEVG